MSACYAYSLGEKIPDPPRHVGHLTVNEICVYKFPNIGGGDLREEWMKSWPITRCGINHPYIIAATYFNKDWTMDTRIGGKDGDSYTARFPGSCLMMFDFCDHLDRTITELIDDALDARSD